MAALTSYTLDPNLGEARVEIAFATAPDAVTPAWVDVSDKVAAQAPVQITRGRQDEYSKVSPGRCTMTLDNTDGWFTAGYSGSPYYPNVKIRRKLRVTARLFSSGPGNLVSGDSSTFEGGTIGAWAAAGSVPPTLTNSVVQAHSGTHSMLITWGTGGSLPRAELVFSGLIIGRKYTATAQAFVPAGSPSALMVCTGFFGSKTTSNGVWQQIAITFIANSTTMTIAIWPGSTPTAGQQAWIDDVMIDEATFAGAFTTSPPVISYRHTGYVDEWPTEWPGGGIYSEAKITSIDRFKRLGNIDPFKSIIEEELLFDDPYAYYTLGDAAGSVAAADTSGNGRPSLTIKQLGTGGTLTFGNGTGPGFDGLTAVQQAWSNASNGKYLAVTLMNAAMSAFTVEACFLTSTTGQPQSFAALVSGTAEYGALQIDSATGHLQGSYRGVTISSSTSVADGATHHAALTWDGTTLRVYLDGTSVGSGFPGAVPLPANIRLVAGALDAAGLGNLFNGTLSHVVLYPAALGSTRIAQHANVILTGAVGERSDQRIARYGGYVGLTTADMNLETGLSTSIAYKDITGQSPLAAMQDIEDTESGVLFMNGQGQLTFHARSHRYNAASVVTIPAEDIDPSARFVENDAYLVNDVTASRPGGITARAVNAASVNDYGTSAINPTLLTTSDNEVVDAANWKANQTSTPSPRLPGVAVDILTQHAADPATMLSLDIGSKFSVNGFPSTAPASSADLFIEGLTETIVLSGPNPGWVLAFNTTPAVDSSVWQLDSTVYSVLDSTTRLAY